jgi:hypothetical protein
LPKKIHNALPGGQNAIVPISTSSIPFSISAFKGIEKYISSPHLLTLELIGSIPSNSFAVFV